jgi:hypothetical protein
MLSRIETSTLERAPAAAPPEISALVPLKDVSELKTVSA